VLSRRIRVSAISRQGNSFLQMCFEQHGQASMESRTPGIDKKLETSLDPPVFRQSLTLDLAKTV
jgi:hypothetical protein